MRALSIALALALSQAGCAQSEPPLDVKAKGTFEGLEVKVPGAKTFSQCAWELNGTHKLLGNFDLEPGQVVIPFSGFVDDAGNRFAWPAMALRKLVIDCDGADARTYVYLTW